MVGEIQSCQSWWLMLEVSFEQRVATVASSGVGHNRTVVSQLPEARVCPSGLNATLVVRAVIVLILAVILASCGGSRSTPATSTSSVNQPFRSQNTSSPNRFSPTAPAPPAAGQGDEQYFIGDVRADTPGSMDGPWVPWPDDQTLMNQGHEVCTILSMH